MQSAVFAAVMKLRSNHPGIIPKIPNVYKLMQKGLPVKMSDLNALGITSSDVSILVEYGILKKKIVSEDE